MLEDEDGLSERGLSSSRRRYDDEEGERHSEHPRRVAAGPCRAPSVLGCGCFERKALQARNAQTRFLILFFPSQITIPSTSGYRCPGDTGGSGVGGDPPPAGTGPARASGTTSGRSAPTPTTAATSATRAAMITPAGPVSCPLAS